MNTEELNHQACNNKRAAGLPAALFTYFGVLTNRSKNS